VLSYGLHHPQSGPHGALGVIFVGQGVAEVDQQAIAQILRDMPLKTGDDLGAGLLIRPHHLAPLLGVELTSKHGRVYQFTEQDRELTAFGLWSAGFGRRAIRHAREGGPADWFCARVRVSDPDEYPLFLIARHAFGVDELFSQRGERFVVELEPKL